MAPVDLSGCCSTGRLAAAGFSKDEAGQSISKSTCGTPGEHFIVAASMAVSARVRATGRNVISTELCCCCSQSTWHQKFCSRRCTMAKLPTYGTHIILPASAMLICCACQRGHMHASSLYWMHRAWQVLRGFLVRDADRWVQFALCLMLVRLMSLCVIIVHAILCDGVLYISSTLALTANHQWDDSQLCRVVPQATSPLCGRRMGRTRASMRCSPCSHASRAGTTCRSRMWVPVCGQYCRQSGSVYMTD